MPDPAKHVAASVRYEIKLLSGPHILRFRSEDVKIDGHEDLVVLARQTLSGTLIVEETVVGIIGGRSHLDASEFLNLLGFLRAGGVIGINRDLL